jgi:1-acyl-sn-glycerol-3-phosphate acyltransferase
MDFIIGQLYYGAIGRRAKFLMKKEWFVFPLGFLLKMMGGVPIDRSKKTSIIEQMASEFARRKTFRLAVTPEGTRQKVKEWKKGFYYIALRAQVPIRLAYIDYKKKIVGFGDSFYPTGNVEKDIRDIRRFYRGVIGRHQEKFGDLELAK